MWSAAKTLTCTSCESKKMENARLKEENKMLKEVIWQLNSKLAALAQRKSKVEAPAPSTVKPKLEPTMPKPCDIEEEESPKCSNCGVSETTAWRKRLTTGELLCNPCWLYERLHKTPRPMDRILTVSERYKRARPTFPVRKPTDVTPKDNIVMVTPPETATVTRIPGERLAELRQQFQDLVELQNQANQA